MTKRLHNRRSGFGRGQDGDVSVPVCILQKIQRRKEIMKIIMLGAPGAGKGTQAKMIADKYGVPHISTGDIFRANIKNGTELGMEAKKYMDQGLLVPDELTVRILLDRVAQDDCKNGFILDGFPRTVPQAEALDAMNIQIDKVIEISVPDETIKERVSGRRVCENCGASYHVRKDDQPETVIERLKTYHEKTAPLKDYYEKQGKLVTVIGQEEVAETSKLTLAAVEA